MHLTERGFAIILFPQDKDATHWRLSRFPASVERRLPPR